MVAEGHGYGKVILFGEHFVVYGLPSIASAVSSKTTATVEGFSGSGYKLIDNRPETPGYKKEKFGQQLESLNRIFQFMGIDLKKNPVKINLDGDLVAASGIGASAASCVAIARALSKYFNLGLSDEKINEIAYEGEKGYHGTPSGIDNTAATYGGLIWFKKGNPPLMELIKIEKPVEIIMADTGMAADTAKVVAEVKERKEKNPAKYEKIFRQAEGLVSKARKALETYDLKTFGMLMDENHRLLQQIEVSCKELDFLVDLARKNGAIGAKMTGTGKGGNMVALTPGKGLQEKVAKAIEKEGFRVFKTKVGV